MAQSLRQTEQVKAEFAGIDTWPDAKILSTLLDGQDRAVASVRAALPAISKAATEIAERLSRGGQLVYAGAGSSIRIAVQDGSELPATFGIDESQLAFLIAGGKAAMFETLADKEDNTANGRAASEICGPDDALIAVAASGRTPFTVACAEEAKARGCFVISVANVPNSTLGKVADVEIVLQTGHEVIAGSTRMGAGTAQKVALNLVSTLAAIKLGAVYDGMMVGMRPQNEKLRERASRIVAQISGANLAAAQAALTRAGNIKAAALLCAGANSPQEAEQLLSSAHGNLRLALARLSPIKKPKLQH